METRKFNPVLTSYFFFLGNEMSDKVKEQDKILYLIVVKEVWDRIVSGDKTIEYRDCGEYWDKRIKDREYDFMKITNGYGNLTRPYRLYEYQGYEVVDRDNKAHYAISIDKSLVVESRDKLNGVIKYGIRN